MKRSLCVMAVALGSVIARAQVPEIYNVTPRAARAGEVIRIRGQDFDAGAANNIVHIGGVRAAVLESWVTELEVKVPPAAQPGPITVAIDGRIAASPTPFQPLFPPFGETNLVFSRRVSVLIHSSNTSPNDSLVAADLDNDGDSEIIVSPAPGRIEIYQHVADGPLITTNSLQNVAVFQVSGAAIPISLRALDFDGDGRIDIVTAPIASSGRVNLLRNIHLTGELSTNSFAPPVSSFQLPQIDQLEFADADRDGLPDAILRSGSSIRFHQNLSGLGTNLLSVGTVVNPGANDTQTMVAGDLDRDGHIEIVTGANSRLTVHSHNQRSGAPALFTNFTISITNFVSLHIADIQGDGMLDLLTQHRLPNAMTIFWNRNANARLASSDFEVVPLYARESELLRRAFLDVNGDALPELLTTRSNYFNESAVLNGIIFGGSFINRSTNHWSYLTRSPHCLAMTDVNADGATDAVIQTFNGFYVFQNLGALTPAVQDIQNIPNARALLTFVGRPGDRVALQSSASLKSWTVITNFTIPPGGTMAYDLSAANQHQFFRLLRTSP